MNFVWVKGHAENGFNNRCDELATTAADGKTRLLRQGMELDRDKAAFIVAGTEVSVELQAGSGLYRVAVPDL